MWTDVGKALAPVSKSLCRARRRRRAGRDLSRAACRLSGAAVALKSDIKKFALAFTAVFWIAYASWFVGSYAHFAAVTPADLRNSESPGRSS